MSETVPGSGSTGRAYDIVLFGATGFVGELTARYLAVHAPAGCRWAVAGRDRAKLEKLRERLVAVDPACATLPLLHADASDPASLRELAASTRVLATTVGPYIQYGEELVAACADAGTDYADLTGEPEFADRMYLRYDARARRSGARIVHACGFDSVPHDLGVYFTVKQLPDGVPLRVDGFVRSRVMFSAAPSPPRSPHWGVGGRRSGPRRSGGSPNRGRWGGGCGPRSAGGGAVARRGPGRCRWRPSTRRWWPVRRPRWSGTARISATGTTRR